MSRKENATLVGVAAVACAACCAGPILGVLAAIGLGTALGAALWGVGALLMGAIAVAVVLRRRRSAAARACSAPAGIGADSAVGGAGGAGRHDDGREE